MEYSISHIIPIIVFACPKKVSKYTYFLIVLEILIIAFR